MQVEVSRRKFLQGTVAMTIVGGSSVGLPIYWKWKREASPLGYKQKVLFTNQRTRDLGKAKGGWATPLWRTGGVNLTWGREFGEKVGGNGREVNLNFGPQILICFPHNSGEYFVFCPHGGRNRGGSKGVFLWAPEQGVKKAPLI